MKYKLILGLILFTSTILFSSCATIFNGVKAKITVDDHGMREPVTLTVDGEKTYSYSQFPAKVKIKRGYSPSTIVANAYGWESDTIYISKKFNPQTLWNIIFSGCIGMGVDAITGSIMKPESKYYVMNMQRKKAENTKDTTIPQSAFQERVSRDNAGKTILEQTIIRWMIDSDPQGARIFYRVISSIPSEVKNTNETYLQTTPFEETRAFNILGLTYENSRDVQIEIKLVKNGYEPQVKRFNVRQAIDQQEISTFFMLVKKEE